MKREITTKTLEGISRKHCHNFGVCEAEEELECNTCDYFKGAVMPTWFKDIEWKHNKKLSTHQETDKYIRVMNALKKGVVNGA